MAENEQKEASVPMITSDLQAHLIPLDRVGEAALHGLKPAVRMAAEGGGHHWIPADRVEEAMQHGMRLMQNNGQPYPDGEAPVIVGHNANGEPVWGSESGAEKEGAEAGGWKSAADAVMGAARGFAQFLDGLPTEQEERMGLGNNVLDDALRPFERIAIPLIEQYNKARGALSAPITPANLADAVRYSAGAAVPMLGPWINDTLDQAAKQVAFGNYSGAVGTILGNAAVAAAGEGAEPIARGVADAEMSVPDRIMEKFAPAEHLRKVASGESKSPQQQYATAREQGVNLPMREATQAPVPVQITKATEQSLLGAPKFARNTEANINALYGHAGKMLDDIAPESGREALGERVQKALQAHRAELVDDPGQRAEARDLLNRIDKRDMDGQEFGAAAQEALKQHHEQMYDRAGEFLTGALERKGALVGVGDVEAAANKILREEGSYYAEHPSALKIAGVQKALDQVLPLASPDARVRWYKAIGDDAKAAAETKAAKSSILRSDSPQNISKLRSDLWNLYQSPDIVKTRPEGWLKHLVESLDESLTSASNENGLTPAEIQKFRAGTSLWKRMKSMYDDPQSPFFSILRSSEPKTIAGTLEKLKPTAAQQFRGAMGDVGRGDLVRQQQRQIVSHILDPHENGQVDLAGLQSRFEKMPKEGLRELLAPQHLNALSNLAKRAQTETPYDTQPRLRQIVEAPDGLSASRAMFTENGTPRLTPSDMRFIQAADPALVPAIQREAASRILNPKGNDLSDLRNFPSRFTSQAKEQLRGVLSEEQLGRLANLADTTKKVNFDLNPSGTAKTLAPANELADILSAGGQLTTHALAGLGAGEAVSHAGVPGGAVLGPALTLGTSFAKSAAARLMTNPDFVQAVMEHQAPESLASIGKRAIGATLPGKVISTAVDAIRDRGGIQDAGRQLAPNESASASAASQGAAAKVLSPAAEENSALMKDAEVRAAPLAVTGTGASQPSPRDRFAAMTQRRNAQGQVTGVSTPPNGGQVESVTQAEPNEVHSAAEEAAELKSLQPTPAPGPAPNPPPATPEKPSDEVTIHTGASSSGQLDEPKPQARLEAPEGATHEVLHPETGAVMGHIVDGEYVPLDASNG